jgi:hypothetical protein
MHLLTETQRREKSTPRSLSDLADRSDQPCPEPRRRRERTTKMTLAAGPALLAVLSVATLLPTAGAAQSCPSPSPVSPLGTCHPSACTAGFCDRGDISPLASQPATQALQDRLVTLDCSPHSIPPLQVFAEADPVTSKSRLFMYYLLDSTGFQPSVFTTTIPGLNDDPSTMLTVWGGNCGLSTIGAVRIAVEPKPDLPSDPDDLRAFIDVFTDIRGLFVINNESGWYEGWMIHDLRVADVDPSNAKGHDHKRQPQFGMITSKDAALLAAMGTGNNIPGNFFTVDGKAPHIPSPSDHFPNQVSNVVPLQLSMGAYNSLQQSDAHSYWEFNYTTNWIHPLYELPFTGGFPDKSATQPADTFRDGEIGLMSSIVPGDEPGANLDKKSAVQLGDNPDRPRDPDLFDSEADSQREFRQRFVPSGIAREAFLNVFERLDSFEPGQHDLTQRLLDGYKAAVATVDTNQDGVISAAEGDIDTCNPNCPPAGNPDCPDGRDNTCIFLTPRSFNRFAVTREINDGLLAPRFAPSTRAWVLSGAITTGFPVVAASEGRDSDDR